MRISARALMSKENGKLIEWQILATLQLPFVENKTIDYLQTVYGSVKSCVLFLLIKSNWFFS